MKNQNVKSKIQNHSKKVKNFWFLFVVLNFLFFTFSFNFARAATKTIRLFTAPGPTQAKIWLAPATYNGKLSKDPVGPPNLTAKAVWHIAQWGIPTELPQAFTDIGNGSWKIENPHAGVTFTPLGSIYTAKLDQKASDFPCAKEFDLLIEPNENRAYKDPPFPQAFTAQDQRPSLALMDALTMRATSRLLSARQGAKCGTGKDLASALFAIVFHNDVKNQGLFYQLVTYDSRGSSFNASWFLTDPNLADPEEDLFGVSDSVSIPELGGTLLSKGGSAVSYNINIASRIKSLIASGHGGIDTDLKNWKVFGAYYGSYVSSGSTIISEYSSLDITAAITAPTCSLAFNPVAATSTPAMVTYAWSTTGDADRQILYDCTNDVSKILPTFGQRSFTVQDSDLTDNVLECTITAESASGQQAECTASFIKDTTPPEVELISPQDGDTVSGTVTLEADASDDESGIASVEFFVNDKSIGVDTTAPYSIQWDSAKILVETAVSPFLQKILALLPFSITHAGSAAVIKPVATNGAGATSTSTPVSVGITCPEVPLPNLPGIPNPCEGPAQYIQYWFYFGLYLAGIAALLVAVAGGTLYMISATMQTAATGKKLMTNALLGLILLFGSWLLLTTLGGAGLTKLKNPVLPPLPPPGSSSVINGRAGEACSTASSGIGPVDPLRGSCDTGLACDPNDHRCKLAACFKIGMGSYEINCESFGTQSICEARDPFRSYDNGACCTWASGACTYKNP